MDVGQAAEELVHVELDEADGDRLLGFAVMTRHFVHRLRDKLQDQVEKHFILLFRQPDGKHGGLDHLYSFLFK